VLIPCLQKSNEKRQGDKLQMTALYIAWPSARTLRDHLDPLLLQNSERALLTITNRQIDLQVIEHTRQSVIQRTFYVGIDYICSDKEPQTIVLPKSVTILPSHDKTIAGQRWFSAVIDLGSLYDLLGGAADVRQTTSIALLATKSAGALGTSSGTPLIPPPTPIAPTIPPLPPLTPAVGHTQAQEPVLIGGTIWKVESTPALAVRLRSPDATTPERPWHPMVLVQPSASEFLRLEDPAHQLTAATKHVGRIAMRFTSDLQDDLLDLSLFGNRAQVTVSNSGTVHLSAQHRNGKHGMVLVYQKIAETPTTSKTTTNEGGSKERSGTASSMRKYLPPYLEVQTEHPHIQTEIRLRAFRIMHKLIGSCVKIEWTFEDHGPLVCACYQGCGPLERRIGLLLLAPSNLGKRVVGE
jgi:hypothetical protein